MPFAHSASIKIQTMDWESGLPPPWWSSNYNGPCQADMPLPLRLLPGTFVPWPTRLSWGPFVFEPAYILVAQPPAQWLAPAAAAVPWPRWLATP